MRRAVRKEYEGCTRTLRRAGWLATALIAAAVRPATAENAPTPAPTSAAAAAGADAGATGTITGRIRFAGDPPARARIDTAGHARGCGGDIVSEELVVSRRNGGLANVVVMVTDAPATGVAQAGHARLGQHNCTFVPHVQSVTAGTELEVSNDDALIHNVHAVLSQRTLFNVAMPLRGFRVRRSLHQPGVITVRCDSGHPWMRAYVFVVPHAFHATSDREGRFVLRGVPAGARRIEAWHESLGTVVQPVDVPAGGSVDVTLTYAPPAVAQTAEGTSAAGHPGQQAQAAIISDMTAKLGELRTGIHAELDKARAELQALREQVRAEQRERLALAARPIYLRYCATCHGAKGDGKGPSAKFLSVMPRDFTRGDYKFRMTPSGTPAQASDVFRTISMGVVGTEMPSWRQRLTEEQRMLLAHYLLSLAPPPDEEDIEPPIQVGAEPPGDEASVARGRELYKKLQCGQCHGPGGAGDGPSAGTMKDGWGNPISAANLTLGYYKGGVGASVIYRTFSTGLSGTPMPSFGDILQVNDRWDLAHYVESLGRSGGWKRYLLAPAGRMTLP